MTGHRNGYGFECLVLDVNTQWDFLDPLGAFPVANLAELLPALRRVVAWTKRNGAPVVSSIESHRPFELSDSGHPICCVDGSSGQSKVGFTVFSRRIAVEVDNTLSVPVDVFRDYQQVIFRKRTDDLLANPKADSLLSLLPVDEFILFGNGIENSIKAAALALMAREKRVTIVPDACGYWSKAGADLALRQVTAKGANLLTIDQLLERKLDRRHGLRWRVVLNGHHGDTDRPVRNGRSHPAPRNGLRRGLTPGARRSAFPHDHRSSGNGKV